MNRWLVSSSVMLFARHQVEVRQEELDRQVEQRLEHRQVDDRVGHRLDQRGRRSAAVRAAGARRRPVRRRRQVHLVGRAGSGCRPGPGAGSCGRGAARRASRSPIAVRFTAVRSGVCPAIAEPLNTAVRRVQRLLEAGCLAGCPCRRRVRSDALAGQRDDEVGAGRQRAGPGWGRGRCRRWRSCRRDPRAGYALAGVGDADDGALSSAPARRR